MANKGVWIMHLHYRNKVDHVVCIGANLGVILESEEEYSINLCSEAQSLCAGNTVVGFRVEDARKIVPWRT